MVAQVTVAQFGRTHSTRQTWLQIGETVHTGTSVATDRVHTDRTGTTVVQFVRTAFVQICECFDGGQHLSEGRLGLRAVRVVHLDGHVAGGRNGDRRTGGSVRLVRCTLDRVAVRFLFAGHRRNCGLMTLLVRVRVDLVQRFHELLLQHRLADALHLREFQRQVHVDTVRVQRLVDPVDVGANEVVLHRRLSVCIVHLVFGLLLEQLQAWCTLVLQILVVDQIIAQFSNAKQ